MIKRTRKGKNMNNKKIYTDQEILKRLEEFLKNPNNKIYKFPHYKLLQERYKSTEDALKKAKINIKESSYQFSKNHKIPDEKIKEETKKYLLKKINGEKYEGNYHRTTGIHRYGSFGKMLLKYDLYGLNIINKILVSLNKDKKNIQLEQEKNFFKDIENKLIDFANKNY